MDTYTLVVASALAAAIMAATMLLRYRSNPRERCLLDWAAAGLFFFGSSAIAVVASSLKLHHFLLPAVANVLYIGGHYLVAAGLRRHLGLRPRYDLLAALAALVLVLHCLPMAQTSVANRIMLFSPLIVGINFSVVRLLWRLPDDDAKSAYLPLMLVEFVCMTHMALRTVFMLLSHHTPLTFMGSQFLQTSGSLVVLLFLSVAFMSCAMITIRHQELALQRVAVTDSLTGWLNRRALQLQAGQEFQRAGAAMSFIMFDIDHFKAINDRHGHQVGDLAITHVTTLAAQALRGYEARFRIGGEEFAVLVTGERLAQVTQVAERLRALIAATPLRAGHGDISMTVSVGIAACGAGDTHWEAALRRADHALFQAKLAGRNRVSTHAGAAPLDADAALAWPLQAGLATPQARSCST